MEAAKGGSVKITVPGSGIWPPVVVTIDAAGQVWIDQEAEGARVIIDPADIDALIAALQAAKEHANG